jgi:hypothetical protein
MLQLSKIVSDRHADTDEPGEPLVATPVTINIAAIRCFYSRRNARQGTRITFTDGGGFAVAEDYATVAQAIVEAVR